MGRFLALSSCWAAMAHGLSRPSGAEPLCHSISWAGISFSVASHRRVENLFIHATVQPDGTLDTWSHWDEGGKKFGAYKDGDVIGDTNVNPGSSETRDQLGRLWKFAKEPQGACRPTGDAADLNDNPMRKHPSVINTAASADSYPSRRDFLRPRAGLGAAATSGGTSMMAQNSSSGGPATTAAKPMAVVRVGLVGVGVKKSEHLANLLSLPGIEIRVVCDIDEAACSRAQQMTDKAGVPGGADGKGASARFTRSVGIAVTRDGTVYVADTGAHTIRQISPEAEVTTMRGMLQARGTADGVASAARFLIPHSIAVDEAGTLYIADTMNHRVRKGVPVGAR